MRLNTDAGGAGRRGGYRKSTRMRMRIQEGSGVEGSSRAQELIILSAARQS